MTQAGQFQYLPSTAKHWHILDYLGTHWLVVVLFSPLHQGQWTATVRTEGWSFEIKDNESLKRKVTIVIRENNNELQENFSR